MAEQTIDLDTNDETESVQSIIDLAPDGDVLTFTGSVNVRMLTLKGRKNVTYRNWNLTSTALPTQSVPQHGPCVVLIEDCENVTIENPTINGMKFPCIAIGIVRSKNTKIIGGEIKNFGASISAIQSYGDFDTIIDGTFIHDIGNVDGHNRGIWLGNVHEEGKANSTRPTVRNCIIQRTGTPGDGTGIAVIGASALIEDCYITDTGGAGIKLAACKSPFVRRTTCLRNNFHGVQANDCDGLLIEDCDLSRNAIAGVYLMNDANVTLRRCRGDGNRFGLLVESGCVNLLTYDCSWPNNTAAEMRVVK